AGRYALFEAGKGVRHLLTMGLSGDGRTLLAVSQNVAAGRPGDSLHAWDVATGKRLPSGRLAGEEPWAGYSRFSPDGRLLALTTGSLHDAATGEERIRLR